MDALDISPGLTPQQYGTAVHTAFAAAVKSQNLPGIGSSGVETSYVGGVIARYYGEPDSIRTDVTLRNDIGDPIAIYDVKTGGASLTPARVRELRDQTGASASVPIIEMHVLRGVTLKGRAVRSAYAGRVIVRRWDPSRPHGVVRE